MTVLLVCVAIAVVAVVAVLLARGGPVLDTPTAEAAHLQWPPAGGVSAQSARELRFTVGLRGYRMDEVDRVIEDLAAELAERDARIAQLQARTALAPTPVDPAEDQIPLPDGG